MFAQPSSSSAAAVVDSKDITPLALAAFECRCRRWRLYTNEFRNFLINADKFASWLAGWLFMKAAVYFARGRRRRRPS